jgi:alcohol dehydrogenase (NADP+)
MSISDSVKLTSKGLPDALGCQKIVAIFRTSARKQGALKNRATYFIATDEDKDWATNHAKSLDLIVCTVSSPKMPFMEYLSLLRE